MPLPPPNSVPLRKFSDLLQCDRIQYPPPGPFCSTHLTWYSECAWIPESRLADFLEGEEHRPLCNTTFKTTQTEPYYCKDTGQLLRTKKRYHCSYGPRDERGKAEGNIPDKRRYENGKIPLRHTTVTGDSVRRGCVCHFHVLRSEDRSNAVQITWVKREHVDKQGRPCHGLRDKTAQFANAHVAPRLSRRTWNFVERLVRTGVSTTEIVKSHFRNLQNHWRNFHPDDQDPDLVWSRDMCLTPRDVKTIRQSVLRKKVDYNTADHFAVHSWTVKNKEKVFLYQQKKDENTPFLLGWSSEWQIKKAATLGHGRAIAMDATFGTNIFDIALFTILCFDDHQNGIPVGHGLLEKAKAKHLILFLDKFKNRVEQARSEMMLDPTWIPICFIIDVASEEILSLRTVFPDVAIILCLWHVRRAWTKNLISKVKNAFNRADMNRELKDLMYNVSADHIADILAFLARWKGSEQTFTEYFDTYWRPKAERWMVQFRTFDHQNQNTNGAVERWHHTLKMHLRTEKATKSGRSVIWLLGMLSEDLEHFYWCMLSMKYQGAIRNKVKEKYVFASIHKARSIEDSQVSYLTPTADGGRRAEVRTYKKDGTQTVHLLENWNKDCATCTCGHSEQGNTCKHQIKVLLMEGYSEMRIFKLLGTKWGSFCGGLEYEYEQLAEEDVDGEYEVHHPCPDEVDISFPLRTFASIEEEVPEDKLDEPYHSYSQDYFVGLVQKGYSKLERLGCQMKNLVVVRLREWVEWICNEEAIANPPDLDQFPLTQFMRLEGSNNSLKRKKDHVELYWEKQQKGTRGKSKEVVAAAKKLRATQDELKSEEVKAAEGWKKVELKAGRKGNQEAPNPQNAETNIAPDDGSKVKMVGSLVEVAATVKDKTVEGGQSQVLPFVQKKKRKETDTQMLERLARESINLNNFPMDYEAPDDFGVGTGTEDPLTVQHGTKGKGQKKPGIASTNSNATTAPKRRGRPVGSKNKPKADCRPPLVALPINVLGQTKSRKGKPSGCISVKENVSQMSIATPTMPYTTANSCLTTIENGAMTTVHRNGPPLSESQFLQYSQVDSELVVNIAL